MTNRSGPASVIGMKHALLFALTACGGGLDGTHLFDGFTSGNLAVDDGTAYFTTYGNAGNHLLSVSIDGGEVVELSPDPVPAAAFPSNLLIVDGRAVWSTIPLEGAAGGLIAASLDTGERELLVDYTGMTMTPQGIAADADFIYFAGPTVMKLPRAGGELEVLAENTTSSGLVVGGNELLYVDGGTVVAINATTGVRRDLATPSRFLFSVVYDADADQAIALTEEHFYRIDLASGAVIADVPIEFGESYFGHLVDRGQIYGWRSVEHKPDCELVRISSDGDVDVLAEGGCGQLAIDGTTLIAAGMQTSAKDGEIVRYDLD